MGHDGTFIFYCNRLDKTRFELIYFSFSTIGTTWQFYLLLSPYKTNSALYAVYEYDARTVFNAYIHLLFLIQMIKQ